MNFPLNFFYINKNLLLIYFIIMNNLNIFDSFIIILKKKDCLFEN